MEKKMTSYVCMVNSKSHVSNFIIWSITNPLASCLWLKPYLGSKFFASCLMPIFGYFHRYKVILNM